VMLLAAARAEQLTVRMRDRVLNESLEARCI
jgi:hypothetical protein